MSSDFPHGPSVADLWDKIDPGTRDAVAKMFVEWLRECLKRLRRDNVAMLAALLAYHKRDLVLVFAHMMKDEFSPYAEQIMKLFGVM